MRGVTTDPSVTGAGDLVPRQVLFLVEWESEEASGTASYVWQTFDGADMSDPAGVSLDDVLAVLKP